jgi:hypothetical protein
MDIGRLQDLRCLGEGDPIGWGRHRQSTFPAPDASDDPLASLPEPAAFAALDAFAALPDPEDGRSPPDPDEPAPFADDEAAPSAPAEPDPPSLDVEPDPPSPVDESDRLSELDEPSSVRTFEAAEPAVARRSFLAQPVPLKWRAGVENAFLTGPPPQSGQCAGGSSCTPRRISNRWPQFAQS